MGAIHSPTSVLFLIAASSRYSEALAWGLAKAERHFGQAQRISVAFTFIETDYYTPTMGTDLLKQFWALGTIDPGELASIKRQTNDWEAEYAGLKKHPEPRPLNLDPGYLTPAKLVGSLSHEVDALLSRMHELAMILRARRFARGALELSMPELKIDLDKNGRVVGAHKEIQTESHQIIEEFMLAANEAVAERLAQAGLIFLRRVHGNPDPRKLKLLTQFVQELGIDVGSLENRFELQKLLDEVKGDPREHAVNFAVLRSMQRAIYSPEEEGHFALASDCYCHFTSPIRRYPDLTVHRLLDALNTGRKPPQSMEHALAVGDHCSEREQRATNAERELNKVKLLNYLSDKIGMELQGVITGVENFGLFITGVELPAEGFVHITALSDDYYKFDRASHTISGFRSGNSYRLGDPVRVAVAAVDVDARELDFRLVGRNAAPKVKRLAKRKAKPTRGKPKKPRKRR